MRNRIRECIVNKGVKQKDLAMRMSMTPVGLSNILRSPMPKIETLEKFARALDVPVWRLCLSDEEIEEIRGMRHYHAFDFVCPNCRTIFKITPQEG